MFAKNGVSRATERRLERMIHQGVTTTMVSFSLFYLSLQSRTLHRDYERIRDRGGTRSWERRRGISAWIELGFFVLPGPSIPSRSSSSPHIGRPRRNSS